MDINEFLNEICKEIKYEPARKGIAEEIRLHVQELKEDYMSSGMQEQEAEEKAISQMGIAEEIGKKLNKIHRPKLDWKLLLLILILIGFGLIVSVLKDSTMHNNLAVRQMMYLPEGLILGVFIYFFDYRKLKSCSNLIYVIASGILILATTGMAHYINGNLFIDIWIFRFIPAIVTVPLYIVAFIGYISDYKKDNIIKIQNEKTNQVFIINMNFIKIVISSIFSLMLMATIQSIVNALLLGFVYIVIITVKLVQEKCAKKLLYIYMPIIVLTMCVIFVVVFSPRGAYRLNRFTASFYPEIDPNGSGYVGMLQKEILENVKLIGEANTKFISDSKYIISEGSNYTFIYLLGKTGILVAGILVLTIILTSLRLIINAKNIKEQYGKFLIIGLGTLYILQSFATILMNINKGIQTNIDLPFVTFGETYFIVNIINIALILSIYRRKDINEYDKENGKCAIM